MQEMLHNKSRGVLIACSVLSSLILSANSQCPSINYEPSLAKVGQDTYALKLSNNSPQDKPADWLDLHYQIGDGKPVNQRLISPGSGQEGPHQVQMDNIKMKDDDHIIFSWSYGAGSNQACDTPVFQAKASQIPVDPKLANPNQQMQMPITTTATATDNKEVNQVNATATEPQSAPITTPVTTVDTTQSQPHPSTAQNTTNPTPTPNPTAHGNDENVNANVTAQPQPQSTPTNAQMPSQQTPTPTPAQPQSSAQNQPREQPHNESHSQRNNQPHSESSSQSAVAQQAAQQAAATQAAQLAATQAATQAASQAAPQSQPKPANPQQKADERTYLQKLIKQLDDILAGLGKQMTSTAGADQSTLDSLSSARKSLQTSVPKAVSPTSYTDMKNETAAALAQNTTINIAPAPTPVTPAKDVAKDQMNQTNPEKQSNQSVIDQSNQSNQANIKHHGQSQSHRSGPNPTGTVLEGSKNSTNTSDSSEDQPKHKNNQTMPSLTVNSGVCPNLNYQIKFKQLNKSGSQQSFKINFVNLDDKNVDYVDMHYKVNDNVFRNFKLGSDNNATDVLYKPNLFMSADDKLLFFVTYKLEDESYACDSSYVEIKLNKNDKGDTKMETKQTEGKEKATKPTHKDANKSENENQRKSEL